MNTIREFFYLLQKHDWTFEYSDSGEVWRRGLAERKTLESKMEGPLFKKVYDDYRDWVFNKGPEPNLEDYVKDHST